jgi:hypothetical protein
LRYGYGPGYEDRLAYAMHGRVFCLGDCDRHPDVTHTIAEQLARERAQAPRLTIADARDRAELEQLLGPAERPPAYLPTYPGDRVEWRRERAPWWHWRRWAGIPVTRVHFTPGTDPWNRPWCSCGQPVELHAHIPGSTTGAWCYAPKDAR